MTETKGGRLEHVTDTRMDVWIVASVSGHFGNAKECWQILVGDDVLHAGNYYAPGTLEYILIAPRRMLLLDAIG